MHTLLRLFAVLDTAQNFHKTMQVIQRCEARHVVWCTLMTTWMNGPDVWCGVHVYRICVQLKIYILRRLCRF